MYETAKVLIEFGAKQTMRPPDLSSGSDFGMHPDCTRNASTTEEEKGHSQEPRDPDADRKCASGTSEREEVLNAYEAIRNHTDQAQEGHDWLDGIMTEVCKLFGGVKPDQLIDTLKKNKISEKNA